MKNIIYEIEEVLKTQIRTDIQYNWREETVVLNLLRKIRQSLNNRTIDYSSEPYKIDFKLFQSFGGLETKFGDISIIVKIIYPDGDAIEGVGFLEAKVRKKKTFKFESIRVSQLKRINSNAPRSLLLLLDYEPIIKSNDFYFRHHFYESSDATHSVVTQINSGLALNKKDISLYKISYPFSIQLFERYFKGLDLEFNKKSLEIAKGYSKDKGYPKHTVLITLSPENLEFDIHNNINENTYEEIK